MSDAVAYEKELTKIDDEVKALVAVLLELDRRPREAATKEQGSQEK